MSKYFVTKGDVVKYTGPNLRKHLRFPVCIAISYHHNPLEPCSDFILSISMGGLFIRTEKPLKIGSKIKMQFRIPPDGKDLGEFDGRIVNVNTDNPDHPMGIFVKFIKCSKSELKRLEDYLEGKKHLLDNVL
jgi:Tfp pilus assembly protein PilZ